MVVTDRKHQWQPCCRGRAVGAQLATSLSFASILALKPAAAADFNTYSWTAVRKEAAAAAAVAASGGGRRNGAVASGVEVVSGLDWSELE